MDMAASVKECAERVVNVLRKTERVNVLSVAEILGERSAIVYQSIGWLAHEGRIRYVQEGNQVYLSLTGEQA
jgi:hypothetical protein